MKLKDYLREEIDLSNTYHEAAQLEDGGMIFRHGFMVQLREADGNVKTWYLPTINTARNYFFTIKNRRGEVLPGVLPASENN